MIPDAKTIWLFRSRLAPAWIGAKLFELEHNSSQERALPVFYFERKVAEIAFNRADLAGVEHQRAVTRYKTLKELG